MPSPTQALQQQIEALATDIDKSMATGQPVDFTKKSKLQALKKQLGQAALKASGQEKITVASQADEEVKKESQSITNFIKAISQKNYASADKYLQNAVNGKLTTSIKKAIDASK